MNNRCRIGRLKLALREQKDDDLKLENIPRLARRQLSQTLLLSTVVGRLHSTQKYILLLLLLSSSSTWQKLKTYSTTTNSRL